MPALEAAERLATCHDADVFRLALLASGSIEQAEAAHAARQDARAREARR